MDCASQTHSESDSILVRSIAMSDLMAARVSYSMPLSYPIRLMGVTNGKLANETQKVASQNGIDLLDQRELMSQLRSSSLTMGRVYTRESDRCSSFDGGIRPPGGGSKAFPLIRASGALKSTLPGLMCLQEHFSLKCAAYLTWAN